MAKYKTLACVGLFLCLGVQNAGAIFYSDVMPNHDNFISIISLTEDGIVNGFSDGTFRPDQDLNRAESVKMLILGAFMKADSIPKTNPFPDVKKDEWFAPYVKTAMNLGVVKGTKEGKFEPARTLNKAEAIKMALLINGIDIKEAKKNPYLDVKKDEWFAPYFAFAKDNSIFDEPSYINPNAEITRGEFAEIIYRVEDYKNNHHPDEGGATYLADMFVGRKTANGEIFSHDDYTCAHQTLPFDTRVLVEYPEKNTSVVVRVNDRGPYAEGNIIDLTKKAFKKLDSLDRGVLNVQIKEISKKTPLGSPDSKVCFKGVLDDFIAKDFYKNITLDQPLPTAFRLNEVYKLEGQLDSRTESNITVFLSGRYFNKKTDSEGKFSIDLYFPEKGKFEIGIIKGQEGSSFFKKIQVIEPICDPNFDEQSESMPSDLIIENIAGDAYFSWNDEWNKLFKLVFTNGEKQVIVYVNSQNKFHPPADFFREFSEGIVNLDIYGAPLLNNSSLGQLKRFKKGQSIKFYALDRHIRQVDESIEKLQLPAFYELGKKIKVSGETTKKLKEKAVIVDPDGEITEIDLSIEDGKFELLFTPEKMGAYIVEINLDTGIALINAPIYTKGFVPFNPNHREMGHNEALEVVDIKRDAKVILTYINKERKTKGLNELEIDEKLGNLAQFRAEDMRDENYFAHQDKRGKFAKDYTVEYGIKASVGENISMDSNLYLAHEGLMASPIHMKNILNPKWSRLGIGLAKRESGEILLVEIFSEEVFEENELETYRDQILEAINGKREKPLLPNAKLNAVAQVWSSKMAKEEFLDFVAPDGKKLQEYIDDAGIEGVSSGMLMNNTSFYDFLGGLKDEKIGSGDDAYDNSLLEDQWENVGIGISVDDLGIIYANILLSRES
ncbi:MAG: septal ring lytic transglycosylase RlpA family protein [Candidatus Gracilibacteria bacterium]|jgi:rare lipoprotein A|nr:septal ring lytic transglycosylase RlpA family protein [Candidatus Gracilibacteria bacterium]